jgi:hypothetical protein
MIALVTGTIGVAGAVLIVYLIRSDRLHVSHGLGWIFTAGTLALLGFAPRVFDALAVYIGVSYPPSLAFTLAFVIITIKLLVNDIHRSRMQVTQQRLVQRIAMLEADQRRLKKRLPENKN